VTYSRIRFHGRIYPLGLDITIDNIGRVEFSEANGLLNVKYRIRVIHSNIQVRCRFDQFTPDHPRELWQKAVEITQAILDIWAFENGVGVLAAIDTWENEKGEPRRISIGDPLLEKVCTVLGKDRSNSQKIVELVLNDPALIVAFNDLILSNVIPTQILISSARSVEALRNLIAGGDPDRNRAWALMQERLNLDRAYISLITQQSIAPRHGDVQPVTSDLAREVRQRAWTIMNRFLHYRLSGDERLPLDSFPLLTG
jgi:hypothetical protein